MQFCTCSWSRAIILSTLLNRSRFGWCRCCCIVLHSFLLLYIVFCPWWLKCASATDPWNVSGMLRRQAMIGDLYNVMYNCKHIAFLVCLWKHVLNNLNVEVLSVRVWAFVFFTSWPGAVVRDKDLQLWCLCASEFFKGNYKNTGSWEINLH